MMVGLEPIGGDQYAIHIIRAGTGGRFQNMVSPGYPRDSIADSRQGLVLLRVNYDASGTVTHVATEEKGPATDAALERAAIVAVKKSTFEPDVVGNHPIAGEALVPFCFTLKGVGIRPSTCNRNGKPDENMEMTNGQLLALDPAAKIITDVVGRTL